MKDKKTGKKQSGRKIKRTTIQTMQRVKLLSSSGNEMTTERINKLLDFFEQAGDAAAGESE